MQTMTRRAAMAVFLAAALATTGCDDHGHDHGDDDHSHAASEGHGDKADDHGHGDDGHDDHGPGEDDHGQDDHGDDHGHDHGDEAVGWTSFSDQSQLFAEYAPLHESEISSFRVHLTDLKTWRPISDVRVKVTVDVGGVKAIGTAKEVAPGIFEVDVAPRDRGEGTIIVAVADRDEHRREVAVSAEGDHDELHEGHDEEGHDHASIEPVSFTLEQQWSIDFGLAQVADEPVRPTFDAFGTLEPRLGGEGVVYANSRGRISGGEIPTLGDRVERGETLAWITPSVAEQGDFASLDLAVRQAKTRLNAARVERDRLKRLVGEGVVPERRLIEANFAVDEAEANLDAAESRLGQARGVSGTGERPRGSIALKAPIDGVIVGLDVPPGLIVEAGRPLFQIVDLDPLWLRVEVPETHIPSLDSVSGVWFTVEGFEQPFELYDVPVSIGGTVDPRSRTLPVIVEVPNPMERLKPGMFANAHVVRGAAAEKPVVPKRAIVFEDGVPVAYAMVDAETFERRPLRLGPRTSGGFVAERGLEAGEWVVTDGAFAVRLAALGDQGGGGHHGHAH